MRRLRWFLARILLGDSTNGECELCRCPITGYAVLDGYHDDGDPMATCIACTPWRDVDDGRPVRESLWRLP